MIGVISSYVAVLFVGESAQRYAQEFGRFSDNTSVRHLCFERVVDVQNSVARLPARIVGVVIDEKQADNPRWFALHTWWPHSRFVIMGGGIGLAGRMGTESPVMVCGRSVTRDVANWLMSSPFWAEVDPSAGDDEMVSVRAKDLEALHRDARSGRIAREIMHDVLNPVTTAFGYSSLLQQTVDATSKAHGAKLEIARKDWSMMRHVVESLTWVRELVASVRDVERQTVVAPVDIQELLRKVSAVEQPSFSSGPALKISIVDDDAKGLFVEGSTFQLQRMLLNLVQNAAKAGATRVRISASGGVGGSNEAWIDVANDGPEPSPDILKGLIGCPREGAGMGLYIVRRIAQAHGGVVEMPPANSGWVVFRIRLPGLRSGSDVTDVASGLGIETSRAAADCSAA